jgi:hypothetical protein
MKLNSTFGLILGLTTFAAGSVRADEADWDVSKMDAAKLPPAAKTEGVTYAKDIRPLFEASCFNCHGEKKQKGELRLDSLEAVLKGGENGNDVVPSDSAKSTLLFAIAGINDKIVMPPKPKGGGGRNGRGPGPEGGPPPAGKEPAAPDSAAPAPAAAKDPAAPEGGPPPAGKEPAGAQRRGGGPPAKPLTPEQVSLVRAWIEQGAK